MKIELTLPTGEYNQRVFVEMLEDKEKFQELIFSSVYELSKKNLSYHI